MSYVGNTPTQQAFTPAIDYFSGDGSTVAFTLSRPVASVAQVQVVVNNVPQNPSTAFTVLNSTITFTGAPSLGTNNIYVEYTSPITQIMQPGQGTVGNTQMASGAALANIGAGGLTQTYVGTNVAGTGPAFLAAVSGSASLAAGTWTKAPLNSETFDTNNNFDSTTNYRFTPTVAGYYQINMVNGQLVNGVAYSGIYKNGSLYYQFGGSSISVQGSGLVYLNGSTDYVELYLYSTNATGAVSCSALYVSMSGNLVRAA